MASMALIVAQITTPKGGEMASAKAHGLWATQSKPISNHPTAHPARVHSGSNHIPINAMGVTTQVTQGMAHRLTHNPATDTP